MSKKTKLILSLIGVCAVVIPAVLLLTLNSGPSKDPSVSTDKRVIDTTNVENVAKKGLPPSSPTPAATGSAVPASPVVSPIPTPNASVSPGQ